MHHYDTMKIIARAYLSNRECSVQKKVYHILPELKQSKIFPAAYFVNTSLPEEIIQVLLPAKNLRKLPDDSPNIFKRSNIDRYMEKPSASFCNGKYSLLNHFCYVKFLAYYTLERKSDKTCNYQLDESDDNLIENNHSKCSYPQKLN